jgi:hypothetical protein
MMGQTRRKVAIGVTAAILVAVVVVVWMILHAKEPLLADDASVPTWVQEDTPLWKLVARPDGTVDPNSFVARKWRYIVLHTNSPREALEAMRQYLLTIPCVAKVEMENPISKSSYYMHFLMTSKDGKVMGLVVNDPKSSREGPTVQEG